MTDYRSMNGDEINRLIAERKGWHLQGVEWWQDTTRGIRDWMWVLTNPEGKRARAGSKDEVEAWHIESNNPAKYRGEIGLPNWYGDANAALELLKDFPGRVELGHDWGEGYFWVLWYVGESSFEADDVEPTRAICRAWLMWWDAGVVNADAPKVDGA